MKFIVRNIHTGLFVEDVSRINYQIEKTTDRNLARIFEGTDWRRFFAFYNDYEIIELDTTCHDCGAKEGQLHRLGCDMESCPFCGNQLISCDCCYKMLNLFDYNLYDEETRYLSPDIYENGLPDNLETKWQKILEKKGRIPFIHYLTICVKCGQLWPDLFNVPDDEWIYYIEPMMRDKVICLPCYLNIKRLIKTRGI